MQVHQKQVEFFKQIGKKLNSNALLAEEIAQALDISKSEAYNKISGKNHVTITQVKTLCNKYSVSFEINAPANLNSCNVRFTPFHTGAVNIRQYLELLNNLMQMLLIRVSKKLAVLQMIYLSRRQVLSPATFFTRILQHILGELLLVIRPTTATT